MENTAAHLPLFRKLALWGTPLGIGLGLLGSAIAMSQIPGVEWFWRGFTYRQTPAFRR